MTIFHAILEISFEDHSVRVEDSADTSELSLRNLSFVALDLAAWRIFDLALAPHRPAVEISLVDSSIGEGVLPPSIELSIFCISLVCVPLRKGKS